MADTAVYLDLVALIPPAIGLTSLIKHKANFREVKSATIVRASCYFMAAVTFDIVTNLGYAWAAIGTLISFFLLLSSVALLAANLAFFPESRSAKESISKIIRVPAFIIYELTLLVWLITTIILQSPIFPANLVLWIATTFYPTALFIQAKKRTKSAHARDTLTVLSTAWFILGIAALPTLLFATGVPILGITLPVGYQLSFLTGSLFYYLMALAVTDPAGLTKLSITRLVPQTIIELGKRYLILHDTGSRTLSFLSNIFRNLVESGSRIIVKVPRESWLLETLSQKEPKFQEWLRSGRIINMTETGPHSQVSQATSDKTGYGISTIYVRNLELNDLLTAALPTSATVGDKGQQISELYLLESNKAPRPQLNEFLKRNGDIKVVDLSEPRDYFSTLVNVQHERMNGSKILLEYDSSADLGLVEKFFLEGIAYAEKCALFTSKSSRFYRAAKGKGLVKIVAASSLVSAPDELSDGEIQIPDRELGLVTSIAADLLENNKTTALRFVFDSIEDLMRGERWEQLYSGVKQLVELLNAPHVTALFLVNSATTEQRFLGAIRALFPAQMKIDGIGIQVKKL